jgi:aminoglycoside 2'-N-acetyltransferase I
MIEPIRLEHRPTADVLPEERVQIRTLLEHVFDGDFAPADWDHCLGGIHVLAWQGAELIGHTAIVQRSLLLDGRPIRVGYVEGMGVRPDWQRRGIGGKLMEVAERIVVSSHEYGALSTSDEGRSLYEKRGWRLFGGRTWVLTRSGRVPTPDDDGGIYLFDPGSSLALGGELCCEPRVGDVW